jgi:predicted ribosome quality control (RQC) complex YloA/Tae2 family protein
LDNLVLASIARELGSVWVGAVLEELRQESSSRFRLRFAKESTGMSVVVSMGAEAPWIGRPSRRWEGPRWSPDPFVGIAARALDGRRIAGITKPAADRSLTLELTGGAALVVELAPHGGNLVLLEDGRVVAALRRTRASMERLAAGAVYTPRPPGQGVDPFSLTAAELDTLIERWRREGKPDLEILRRQIRGIGTLGATLVLEESHASGESVGSVLHRRIQAVLAGELGPRLQAPEPPWEAVARGTFDSRFRLLPWDPDGGVEHASALEIAGLFHECSDAADHLRARLRSLLAIVRAEAARAEQGERRARDDASAFAKGEDAGRAAEALLAGLAQAERIGDRVSVPDPYDAEGGRLTLAAPPGVPLTRVAEDLFKKQRRARRGATAAAGRAGTLRARRDALADLAVRHETARSEADALAIEAALRAGGVPVGLARSPRAARAQAAVSRPAISGVRVVTSRDGFTILVGQTGRDNDRLTFKLAAPDDVWLHASGVPGAHVVIRVGERGTAPPESTLEEAARLAAWFSDARGNATVDVQWTRRKNVRRARGASPGTVLVKRFEVKRVRPIDPRESVP